ncbi:MAG: hypothetical protein QM747_21615 [Nocardioides sp.]
MTAVIEGTRVFDNEALPGKVAQLEVGLPVDNRPRRPDHPQRYRR